MFWITGANGLLGKALTQCKAALHLNSGTPNVLLGTGSELDISDMIALQKFAQKNPGITHVINAAAFSLVDAAEERRDEAFRANVVGPRNLSLVAGEIGARLIHISTDYVFTGDVKRPLREVDPVGPCNYYGKTKLEGEQLRPEDLIIRTSWIFGDGGKNFVAKLFQMLLTQKEIRLTNDQWGRPTYAPDLAEAIFQMRGAEGLYHYANQGVATKYEFGLAMREEALVMGFPVVTESILPVSASSFPSVCKRPVYSAFDTTKIEKQLTIRHWRLALRDFLCAQLPAYL